MASIKRGLVIALLGSTALAAPLPTASTATAATSTTLRSGSPTGDPYSGSAQWIGTTTMLGETCDTVYGGTLDSSAVGPITSVTWNCPTQAWNPRNLPWGVTTIYSPVPGGPDATVTIGGFGVSIVMTAPFTMTCSYGGNLTGRLYNPDNPNRPDPSSPYMQAQFTNVSLAKLSAGSSFLCPGTTTYSGLYNIIGGAVGPLYLTS